MFRELRRKNQALPEDVCVNILRRGTSGVLALAGDGDYPYALPISYAYCGGALLFHSAKAGHKLDAIRRNPKASFCVIDQDQVVPEEYTTYFRSVIAFGVIRELEGQEKRRAIEILARRYAPDRGQAELDGAVGREWDALCMLELAIESLTGKEAVELSRRRRQDA